MNYYNDTNDNSSRMLEHFDIVSEPSNQAASIVEYSSIILEIEREIYHSGHVSFDILIETFKMMYSGVMFYNFSPFIKPFNEMLALFEANGLMELWRRDYVYRPREIEDIGPQVLTMGHLHIGFLACLIPLFICIIVFFGELSWSRIVAELKMYSSGSRFSDHNQSHDSEVQFTEPYQEECNDVDTLDQRCDFQMTSEIHHEVSFSSEAQSTELTQDKADNGIVWNFNWFWCQTLEVGCENFQSIMCGVLNNCRVLCTQLHVIVHTIINQRCILDKKHLVIGLLHSFFHNCKLSYAKKHSIWTTWIRIFQLILTLKKRNWNIRIKF